MTVTIREKINQETEKHFLTFRETYTPPDSSLEPFKPCPSCPGVLRAEGETFACFSCGAVLSMRAARG